MSMSHIYTIEKDHIRQRFSTYIKKAFRSIPEIANPVILDIGCGTGVSVIVLARLSNGTITGIDIDDISLDLLREKIKKDGFERRISIINDSIITRKFQDESFDIIWAEGSLFILGFEKSLSNWYRLIKPNGFLVVHDDKTDMERKLEMIPRLNYSLINHFEISEIQWYDDYFLPLEILIKEFKMKYPTDQKLNRLIRKDQADIETFRSNPSGQSSFYAIMQKIFKD